MTNSGIYERDVYVREREHGYGENTKRREMMGTRVFFYGTRVFIHERFLLRSRFFIHTPLHPPNADYLSPKIVKGNRRASLLIGKAVMYFYCDI